MSDGGGDVTGGYVGGAGYGKKGSIVLAVVLIVVGVPAGMAAGSWQVIVLFTAIGLLTVGVAFLPRNRVRRWTTRKASKTDWAQGVKDHQRSENNKRGGGR